MQTATVSFIKTGQHTVYQIKINK